ncbi:res subunit [Neisseria musculi]|uniref:Type III restriction enzyme res subunit n=1 Tax=Neisseria musculi TaxID=1815583 RepID=A0A7H1MBV9_9NEIS|nr:type III restriction enzyme, res subunit [Neisseria musculi]
MEHNSPFPWLSFARYLTQIAAAERILWKIRGSFQSKNWGNRDVAEKSGGYIWHTTGSGKTLTSFKAARLATELEFIDKVFLWSTAKTSTIKR